MKKIMFLLYASAVLTTFAALANAQVHEVIIPPERPINLQPALQNLQPAIQNLQPAIQSESLIPQRSAISDQSPISRQSTTSEQSTRSSSVTIQATPTPDESYHPPEGHHHPEDATPIPAPLMTAAPLMTFGGGERYPQTRTRLIKEEEAAAMSYAQLRYAINEIYARHGADFPRQPAIAKRFRQFEWYHPKGGVLMTEIENEFSETERANEKVLGRYRDQRRASGER